MAGIEVTPMGLPAFFFPCLRDYNFSQTVPKKGFGIIIAYKRLNFLVLGRG